MKWVQKDPHNGFCYKSKVAFLMVWVPSPSQLSELGSPSLTDWTSKTQTWCCGLNVACSHTRLMCVNTQLMVVEKPEGLMEEVSHWGLPWGFIAQSHFLFSCFPDCCCNMSSWTCAPFTSSSLPRWAASPLELSARINPFSSKLLWSSTCHSKVRNN